jgi:hypothetical protein
MTEARNQGVSETSNGVVLSIAEELDSLQSWVKARQLVFDCFNDYWWTRMEKFSVRNWASPGLFRRTSLAAELFS